MKTQRIAYIDRLRIMAAFFVIFMHTAATALRRGFGADWELSNALTSLAFTAVPIFFMISGFLLLSDERTEDLSVLFKRRIPKLLIPLAAWTAVYLVWSLLCSHSLSAGTLVRGLASAFRWPAATHLWYLYTLIAFYLLSPLLRAMLRAMGRKLHILLLALICAVNLRAVLVSVFPGANFLNWQIFDRMLFFDGNLCSFLLGFYLGNAKKRVPNGVLIPLTAVLLAAITAASSFLTHAHGEFDATFMNQSAGLEVALAACIFLLFRQSFNGAPRRISLLPCAPLTLGMYLMHLLVISILQRYGLDALNFPQALISSIGNFIFCLLCVKTAASIKGFGRVFTGLSFAEADRSCTWQHTFRRLRGAEKGR